jgi:hypothetical protein
MAIVSLMPSTEKSREKRSEPAATLRHGGGKKKGLLQAER